MANVCTTGFLNCTQIIGQIVGTTTEQTTGSLFLTFLGVLLLLMAIAMIFRIRLEYTAILILPLLLSYMAYYQEFIGFGALLLIYLAIIVTKNFIIK